MWTTLIGCTSPQKKWIVGARMIILFDETNLLGFHCALQLSPLLHNNASTERLLSNFHLSLDSVCIHVERHSYTPLSAVNVISFTSGWKSHFRYTYKLKITFPSKATRLRLDKAISKCSQGGCKISVHVWMNETRRQGHIVCVCFLKKKFDHSKKKLMLVFHCQTQYPFLYVWRMCLFPLWTLDGLRKVRNISDLATLAVDEC